MLALEQGGDLEMMIHRYGVFDGGWLALGLFVLLVVLIVLFVLAFSRGGRPAPPPPPPGPAIDPALQILRERFARGEISAEEFEQRRKTLGSP
jgi:putative membrane protein